MKRRLMIAIAALGLALGAAVPAALAMADGTGQQALVGIPMASCSGSYTALFEDWGAASGAVDATQALDDYFAATEAVWVEVPAVGADLATPTRTAVAKGGWIETESPAGEHQVDANLVAGGKVVTRFHVEQRPDGTWLVSGFDHCPPAAERAGLVMADGS